jgi:hypothetical protein
VIEHFTIYQEDELYNAFPSIVKRDDGSYYMGFRQAPDWSKVYPLKGNHNHVDAAAQEVYITSEDGIHWTTKARTLYNHFHCGLQDICITKLRDGTLFATFFMYRVLHKDDVADKSTIRFYINEIYVHRLEGMYSIRSTDGGLTWDEPIEFPFTDYVHREKVIELPDSSLLTANYGVTKRDEVIIARSCNRGKTWIEQGRIHTDTNYQLLEPSLYRTESGKLVAFIRTQDPKADPENALLRTPLVTTESFDDGKTWSEIEFQNITTPNTYGVMRLNSGNVLLTYGYRYEPFGIHAVVMNAECSNLDDVEELVVRDDGGGYDVGYTSAVQMDDGRILITYYYTLTESGPWFIAGTLCEEV